MQNWGYPSYKKLTEIKNPGIKYVFLEEKTDVGGWNWGSWNLEKQGDRWWDPIVVRHGSSQCLAFSDGHAVQHQWRQKSTLAMTYVAYPDCIAGPSPTGPTTSISFAKATVLRAERAGGRDNGCEITLWVPRDRRLKVQTRNVKSRNSPPCRHRRDRKAPETEYDPTPDAGLRRQPERKWRLPLLPPTRPSTMETADRYPSLWAL